MAKKSSFDCKMIFTLFEYQPRGLRDVVKCGVGWGECGRRWCGKSIVLPPASYCGVCVCLPPLPFSNEWDDGSPHPPLRPPTISPPPLLYYYTNSHPFPYDIFCVRRWRTLCKTYALPRRKRMQRNWFSSIPNKHNKLMSASPLILFYGSK